jgi:hypothetical protein
LIKQTERCLRSAGMNIDSRVARSLEKSSNEFMAVLERLTGSKKTDHTGNPTG